jgi:hypothetical protein
MRVRGVFSAVGIFLRAQLITGIVIGVALRLAMRTVALTDDAPGTLFTVGGTLAIVLVATVMGAVPSLLFFSVRRFLPGSTRRRGVLFGAGMLVLGGVVAFPEALSIGIPALNLPMFGVILVAYGVVFSTSVAWLERRASWRRSRKARRKLSAATELPPLMVPTLRRQRDG